MIKFLLFLSKTPEVSRAAFESHVETVYLPKLRQACAQARFTRWNLLKPDGTVRVDHIKDVPPPPGYDGFIEGFPTKDGDLAGLADALKSLAAAGDDAGPIDQTQSTLIVVENHRSDPRELRASAGAPDDGSMVKQVVNIGKRPGMSRDDFVEYYETRHVPLAVGLVASFAKYERNFVRHDLTRQLAVGPIGMFTDRFDVMTVLWFRDAAGQKALEADMADPNIGPRIAADEQNVFDRSAIQLFLVQEHVLEADPPA